MTQSRLTLLGQLYKPAKRSMTRILAACDIMYCDMIDAILDGKSTATGVLPNMAAWEWEMVRDRMLDDGVRAKATYNPQRKCWEYKAVW